MKLILASLFAALVVPANPALAEPLKAISNDRAVVGGAVMTSGRTVVENLSGSIDHARFIRMIKAAGAREKLSGNGPVTVFAPRDTAFRNKRPDDVFAYMVPGRVTVREVKRRTGHHGFIHLTTLSGHPVSLQIVGGKLWVHDVSGNAYRVRRADVMSSNGVIHVLENDIKTTGDRNGG